VTAQPVDALQYALASEHAAVYGYGLLAAQLTGADLTEALHALDHHRSTRDQLRASSRLRVRTRRSLRPPIGRRTRQPV